MIDGYSVLVPSNPEITIMLLIRNLSYEALLTMNLGEIDLINPEIIFLSLFLKFINSKPNLYLSTLISGILSIAFIQATHAITQRGSSPLKNFNLIRTLASVSI